MNPENVPFLQKKLGEKQQAEEGRELKHEDELKDISNVDLSKFNKTKIENLKGERQELTSKAKEEIGQIKLKLDETSGRLKGQASQKVQQGQELLKPGKENLSKEGATSGSLHIPLIEQVTHAMHNVTEKIVHGVESVREAFMGQASHDPSLTHSHSLKETVQEGYHNITNILSHSVEAVKIKLATAKRQIEKFMEEEDAQQKNLGGAYHVGQEFYEITDGFSKTVNRILQQDDFVVEEENPVNYGVGEEFREVVEGFSKTVNRVFQRQRFELEDKRYISYAVGEEFREVVEGFSKTVEHAFEEEKRQRARKGGITEEEPIHYKTGEEFQEIREGFAKTVDHAFEEERIDELNKAGIKENPFEPFGEKDINITQRPEGRKTGQDQDEDLGSEYIDFKFQDLKEVSREGLGNKDSKSRTENVEKDLNYLDQLLDASIAKGKKTQFKEEKRSSEIPSSQSGNIELNEKYASSLTQKVNEDIKYSDNLLNNVIYSGKKIEPQEASESSATNLYSQNLKKKIPGASVSKENQENLTEKANRDIENNDKLLEKAIQEVKKTYPKFESEGKETAENVRSKGEKFRDITNEVTGVDFGQKSEKTLSQKVARDIEFNDKLLE